MGFRGAQRAIGGDCLRTKFTAGYLPAVENYISFTCVGVKPEIVKNTFDSCQARLSFLVSSPAYGISGTRLRPLLRSSAMTLVSSGWYHSGASRARRPEIDSKSTSSAFTVSALRLCASVAILSSPENSLTVPAFIATFPSTSRSKGCFCTTYHPENRNSAGLSSHQRLRAVGERSRSLLSLCL